MLYFCKIILLGNKMKLKVKYLFVMGLVMAMAAHSLKAEPIDSVTVKMVAQNFFRSLSAESSRSTAEPVIVYKAFDTQRNGTRQYERDYYYIVNIGRDGYVIVSGDSRVRPILGYSTTSTFDGNMMPVNMASFMEEYKEQIKLLCDSTEMPEPSVSAAWESLRHQSEYHPSRDVVIGPLLTSKWQQKPYYNAHCPSDPEAASGHASAGCTAVAMGQVIRYWGYPVHGVGSYSYESNNSDMGIGYGDYGTLTVDFSAANYDYDNMPDSLTSSSSQTEIDAVATLLYHCGVSLNTAYGIYSSSAVIAGIDDALRNYFAYENPQHVYRSVYSESEWLNMMKSELNQWRPMIYTGAGVGAVHAFVCDGYDNQNFFHMNWGWGGYADGYFLLSNLNPTILNYNSVQTAITNIVVRPPSLILSDEQLVFFEDEGAPAEIKRVGVQTINVENDIQVSVTGEFSVSSDSVTFTNQLTLPPTGGSVYVKFFSDQTVSNSEIVNMMLNAGPVTDSVRLVGLNYVPACNAPLSMTGVQGDIDTDTNQVLLTWQAPTPDITNVSWDSVATHTVGGTNPYSMIVAHRLDVVDLLPLHHHRLTHVAFIAYPDVTEYRVLVYKGGAVTNHGMYLESGRIIVDKTVNLSELTMGTWNSVALDTPIVIDASEELWYGLSVTAPANTSTVALGGTECIRNKGNIFGYYFLENFFWYSNNENFVLKAVVDNPFIQYELYRDGDSLAVLADDTVYADYPPAYAHYEYEVRATWNNQCGNGAFQMVNFRAPCHVVNEADYITACDSFVWKNDTTYFESGNYIYEYYNEDECWQVDTLHLIVNQSNAYTDVIEACDSLQWIDGVTYYESISGPVFTLTNEAGCDSVVTLDLTIHRHSSAVDSIVACDAYTWIDSVTYTESTDMPVYVLTNSEGCDSIVNLHLTINHSSSSIDSVVACDSYLWEDGVTYTESTQTPTVTYTNAEGCDSIVTLHLTILNSSYRVDTVISCLPYTWIDGNTYTETTYEPTLVYENAVGCDSIVNLHLIILQADTYIDTIVACDSYTWLDGNTYTESISGPTAYFTDVIGCENATVVLNLTILPSSSSEIYVDTCDSYTWINGVTYTESTNEATMVYTNAVGCDSVVTLHLTMHHSVQTVEEITACDSLTWIDGVTYWTSTEEPFMIYTSSEGCDSTVFLHLTLNYTVQTVDEQTVCDSLTWVDGVTYTESTDTPVMTYTSVDGCDSVVTLHLTVYHAVMSVDEQDVCDSLTWLDGLTYFENIEGPVMTYSNTHGCDSIVTLRLTVRHSTSAIDSVVSETPVTWLDGNTYTQSIEGPTVVLTNEAGCDSVVTLHLDIIVSVENHACQEQLKVYPNPSNGLVRLQLPQDLADAAVELSLYDMYGKLLQRQQVRTDNPVLDLSHYAQGMYFIQVRHKNQLVGSVKISKTN